jgi:hypothetical protein
MRLPTGHYDGVQVFSATKAREREVLGERVTAWLRAHPEANVVAKGICMSSDHQYHCLSIVLFWTRAAAAG